MPEEREQVFGTMFSPCNYGQWFGLPDLRQYISLRNTSRSQFGIGGMPDDRVLMGHADFIFIDFVLLRRPWKSIVEFGTWTGLTSLYLGMAARLRQIPFTTYDYKDFRLDEIKMAWLPAMEFQEVNLLGGAEPAKEGEPIGKEALPDKIEPDADVVQRISRDGVLLLVDNGNKVVEANSYCPHLKAGSAFMIHDWGCEVLRSEIQEMLRDCGFVMEGEDVAEMLGSHLRYFVKG